MQEKATQQPDGQWPYHPDSLKATFIYRMPMFVLGVVVGYVAYGIAKLLFV